VATLSLDSQTKQPPLSPLLFVARLAFRSTRALSYQAAQRHARIWDDIRSAQFWLLIPVLGMATVLIRPALLGALANQSAIRAILSWLPEYSAWCAAVSALAFLHFGADKYVAIKRELSIPDCLRHLGRLAWRFRGHGRLPSQDRRHPLPSRHLEIIRNSSGHFNSTGSTRLVANNEIERE
jgi:hypothetical protein